MQSIALEHTNLSQFHTSKISFLQTESSKRRFASKKAAVELLQRKSLSLSSEALAPLLSSMADSPFAKVIGMAEDLIAKLKAEAAAEAAHKAWCDGPLKANKLKRNAKTTKVEELTAAIAELNHSIKEMGQKIETLVAEQADLAKQCLIAW